MIMDIMDKRKLIFEDLLILREEILEKIDLLTEELKNVDRRLDRIRGRL